jgi:hypothetical protein
MRGDVAVAVNHSTVLRLGAHLERQSADQRL